VSKMLGRKSGWPVDYGPLRRRLLVTSFTALEKKRTGGGQRIRGKRGIMYDRKEHLMTSRNSRGKR